MIYDLPKSVEINGVKYEIRSDYRVILDIIMALEDPELDNQDKAIVALEIFYPGFDDMPVDNYKEAIEKCYWFIDGGEDPDKTKRPKLMDWEQDFRYIVAPVSRVAGQDIRAMEYLHWWSFLSMYMEIGECTFAQIVAIRDKKVRGKTLDKFERDYYRRNQKMIDLKSKYTSTEDKIMSELA